MLQDGKALSVRPTPVKVVGQRKSAKTGEWHDRRKPDLEEMVRWAWRWAQWIQQGEEVQVYLELIQPRPGRGHIGTAILVESATLWRGVLAAVRVPVEQLTPVWWKGQYFDLKKMKDLSVSVVKRESRRKAAELFPSKRAVFELAKNDGLAEALLIAKCGEDLRTGRISFRTKRRKKGA